MPTISEIRPDSVYPLQEAQRVSGLGATTFRRGRKSGQLSVLYVGRTAFVEGSALIDFIRLSAQSSR